MSRPSKLSLRGLALAVLVPCLLTSAVLLGWITYRDLYGIILTGFDKKLEAVSTGTAAFIDGDAHREIRAESRLVGLADDPSQPFMWGLDEIRGRLVAVDVATGGARPWSQVPLEGANGLVWDAAEERLLTVVPATGSVLSVDPSTEDMDTLGLIASGSHALALDGARRRLIVAGPWGLRGYDLDALGRNAGRESSAAWTAPDVRLQAMVVNPATRQLIAIDDEGALVVADSVGAAFGPPQALQEDETDEPGPFPEVRALVATAAVERGEGDPVVFAAGSRLIRLDVDGGAFVQEPYRRFYRDPSSRLYVGYFQPMGRVMSTRDITYLYTQQLVGAAAIEYVVDATSGEEHSPIGAVEAIETPEEMEGLAAVVGAGIVYTSEIEDSEDWGLLKSTYAPIYRGDGSIDGMVGADVSVATIQDKTRVALASVGLVTLAILFLGSLSTLWISRRLATPIGAVQNGATHVAAGHLKTVIEPPRIRELAVLTHAFNEMTETLRSSVDELQGETTKVEVMRTGRHLVRELATRRNLTTTLAEGVHAEDAEGRVDCGRSEAVECTLADQAVIVAMLCGQPGLPVPSLASRAEFALLANRVASTLASSVEELLAILSDVVEDDDVALAVVTLEEGIIRLASPGAMEATLIDADGSESRVTLPPGEPYRVPDGSILHLSSRDAPGATASEDGSSSDFRLTVAGVPA